MKAVILAAGKGTRMRGLCNHTPKPMLPIGNRSVISLLFSRLKSVGIEEVALVIGFEGEKLQALIGDGSRYGMKVTYVWQKEQLGTGHAALICEDFVAGEPFVLIFGDILTPAENFGGMVELFNHDDCDAVLSVFPVDDPSNGAAVDVKDGLVIGIIEKPPPGTVLNAYNNAGVFIWPADIFDLIRGLEKSPRGEYEFTDGILRFMEQGRRLAAFELRGYWENITDPEACVRMNRNVLSEALPPAQPHVDPAADVAEGADLVDSRVEAGAVIGRGCKLNGCVVAAGARLSANVKADYVEIQADAAIGSGCLLGANVSIGEGAVVEANARIGPNASVGPRCTVREGASLASSIMLDGSDVGTGTTLVNVVLDYGGSVADGEHVTGMPDKVVEILANRE